MSGWGWGVTHRRGAFWSPRIIALLPRLSMRELIPCSSQATQGFSSRSVMYSWTQSSLGSAQTCRPFLVQKLWREAEGLHTGECNWAGGDPGPPGTPPSFCPGHLRACPHSQIMSPSPWGSQTFLGLLWGSPQKASIVVWQMRERTASCCRSSPLLPLPRGKPPGPSAGPKPGEKTQQGPPWCPELQGGA